MLKKKVDLKKRQEKFIVCRMRVIRGELYFNY